MHDQLLLLAAILARWQCPVAFSEALDLLLRAMCAVLCQCTAMATKMDSKVGAFCHCCFVCCRPGGSWGDTEQVVAWWHCPVASSKALDILQWSMHTALHPSCLCMVVKMAHIQSTFVHHCPLFCIIIHSYKTILQSIKTNTGLQ